VKKVTKISNIFTKSKMDLFCLFLYCKWAYYIRFVIVIHIYSAKLAKVCLVYFLILSSVSLVTLLLQKVFLCKIYKACKFHNS